MTEEFKMELESAYKDELEGHELYEKLAHTAHEQGLHRACGILKDIAHEESTHADLLMHILGMEESE